MAWAVRILSHTTLLPLCERYSKQYSRADLYSVGVLSCVFHLANGIWTFGITWGLWITPEAQAGQVDSPCIRNFVGARGHDRNGGIL